MKHTNILLIDTATEACSAALFFEGQTFFEYQVAPRKHADLILPMVHQLMEGANVTWKNLHALAFVRGPGAFTGVRIATGVIQGLAISTQLPVIGISSLALMAQQAVEVHGAKHILAAIDARMNEVYWGVYRQNTDTEIVTSVCEEVVIAPNDIIVDRSDVEDKPATYYAVGTGWETYPELLVGSIKENIKILEDIRLPSSVWGAKLVEHAFRHQLFMPLNGIQPIYLRNNVAKKSSKQTKLSK